MIITPLRKSRFVFFSYATEDSVHADVLMRALHERSIDTWAALSDLKPGDVWDEHIEQAVSKSSALCVIASRHSVASKYVRAEVEQSIAADKLVVPICIDDCELPLRWKANQHMSWRVEGDYSVPLRPGQNQWHSEYSETLESVVSQLSQILPRATRAEFLRLLELPSEQEALKDLIQNYYEWIPDGEIRYGRRYERSSWGQVFVNRMVNGGLIDISVDRVDSSGDAITHVFLGSVHSPVLSEKGSAGLDFQEVLARAERQKPSSRYDSPSMIVIFSRRRYWTPEANALRKSVETEWRQAQPSTYLTIMSYDRLLDNG